MLVGETMLALVPKLETGGGFEYSMSAFGTHGGCSVVYSEKKHDAAWLGAEGEAQLNDLAFDFRISLLPSLPVQPHVILGMGFKRLSVDGAAADGLNGSGWSLRGELMWKAGRW